MKLGAFLLHLLLVVSAFTSNSVLRAQTYQAEHTGLQLTAASVVLPNKGYSAYIDASLLSASGAATDVTRSAAWSSGNTAVAIADSGRILALARGSAVVTVSYNGYTKPVNVTVQGEENLEPKYALSGGTVLSTGSAPAKTREDRNQIIKSCSAMINCSWRPVQNILGFDGFLFKAGAVQTGIPYSYTENLCDPAAFQNALSSKYFYKNMIINGVSQPYYGSDCSGFVSLAWKLSERYDTEMLVDGIKYGTFAKIGSYNSSNPSPADLRKAYAGLLPGDAVVMRQGTHGHTFIIAANDADGPSPQVFAYEQTPPYCQFTCHTYAEMAEHGFMPFTLKKLKS